MKGVKKLKNMLLSSVDLCRIGANQKANIQLIKNMNNEESHGLNVLKNISSALFKTFGIKETDENMLKMTDTITEALFDSEEEKIKKTRAESIKSIINDNSMDSNEKSKILEKSISEFFSAAVDFAEENQNFKKSEGDESNMLDVNKMTAEDKAIYDDLMKKYNSGECKKTAEAETEKQKTVAEQPAEIQKPAVEQQTETHPEVKKALDDVHKKLAELDEMKKSYELKELEIFAKKYEILGKKPEELAAKLYDCRKSGETVYNDYIALLDENLAMTKNLGIFNEIGTSRSGGAVQKQLEQKIQEITKSNTSITYEQAFVKACDENEELRKAFE